MHNVTLRRFRVTTVAVEKQQVLYTLREKGREYACVSVFFVSYYIVICGLLGCTAFLHIIS